MKINPTRLKELREAKGLSRKGLAKLSYVSAKQIQRLESLREASKIPRDETVKRLVRALDVKPEVLSGDEPPPESESPLIPPSVRVSQRLCFGVRLAYDLVEKRYGVKASDIINAAPLFFVLLAEGSLAWRRNELTALKEKLKDAWHTAEHSNRHRGAWHAGIALDHLGEEEEAIDARNLFSDPYSPDYWDFDVDHSKTTNPFAEYLQKLSEDLDVPGLEVDEGFALLIGLQNMPSYSVCKDKLREIASTGGVGTLVLESGDVRISDIPEHMRSKDGARQREEWLASRASEETIQWLKKLTEYQTKLGLAEDANSPGNGDKQGTKDATEVSR